MKQLNLNSKKTIMRFAHQIAQSRASQHVEDKAVFFNDALSYAHKTLRALSAKETNIGVLEISVKTRLNDFYFKDNLRVIESGDDFETIWMQGTTEEKRLEYVPEFVKKNPLYKLWVWCLQKLD